MAITDAIHRTAKTDEENVKDFYQTPYVLTEILCQYMQKSYGKDTSILDPCAGKGAMTKVIKNYFPNTVALDKFHVGDGIIQKDFFDYEEQVDIIIANPPYSQKNAFIDHAMRLAKHSFILLPVGVDNYTLFNKDYRDSDHYRGKVMIYPKFIMDQELKDTGKVNVGGMSAYAWYHFTPNYGKNIKYEAIYDLRNYYNDIQKYL
jgi:hypothetical protein